MSSEVLAIFREEGLDLVQRALAALNRAANAAGSEQVAQVTEVCRLLHTLKGAAAAVGHDPFKLRVHKMEDRLEALGSAPDARALEPVFRELESIESELVGGEEPQSAELADGPVQAKADDTQRFAPAPKPEAPEPAQRPSQTREARPQVLAEWLRVSPERVDQLQANLAELVLTRLQQDELVDNMFGLRQSSRKAMKRQRDLGQMLVELRGELSPESFRRLRLGVQMLTRAWGSFHEGLQEVCREAQVLQAQSTVVSQTVEDAIQDLRLMPLAPFLEGFAKAARNAARREGKQVRFEVSVDHAEVDRSALMRLHDALLHLVTNAVAHGIEAPEERRLQGKDAAGTLTLRASAAGDHVLLHVTDDGAGVDVERVREKARSLNLLDSEDVLELLTHPGFSTRAQVDDVAGRGVGLDVVADIVRGLQGSMELSSRRGEGTTFTIRVPVAASTTRGLLLELGARRFGLMLSSVERVVRPSPRELGYVEGRPTVQVDGERVGVVMLEELLELGEELGPPDERVAVVVLRDGRRRLAVAVPEIPEEQALLVRPFGRAFRKLDLFVGGSVQPDHSVVPVLSTPALFRRVADLRRGPAVLPAAKAPAKQREESYALVVDDSITMRTMLRNILTAAGYHVTVAEDGVAALDALRSMERCNIVITDLQMPRMEGTELCRRVRAQAGPYIPIVMVTSVEDDEEKAKALSAGADAYVVKAKFEQVSFLERIDTLARGPL